MRDRRTRRAGRVRVPPEVRQAQAQARTYARRLFNLTTQWMNILEQRRNWDNGRLPSSLSAECKDDPTHRKAIQPLPGSKDATHVLCVAPRGVISDDVLIVRVILPLRQEGYEVTEPTVQACGCATFEVRPRWLARYS